jgi:hypothetical protein
MMMLLVMLVRVFVLLLMAVLVRVFVIVAMMMLMVVGMVVLMLRLLCPELFSRQLFLSGNDHVNFGCADAAPVHAGDFQMRIHAQSPNGALQELRRNSGVHQGAEKHVAADPGEAF